MRKDAHLGKTDGVRSVTDLDLGSLDPAKPTAHLAAWESVVKKLTHRHMPPIGMPRPDEATYDKVVSELTAAIDKQALESAD